MLTTISGVTFDEAWPARQAGRCLGIEVFVIGLDALIQNKRAAGRDKDLIDLKHLEKKRKSR